MNVAEFKEWLSWHFSRFPSAAGWLAKKPTRPKFEGDPTQITILEAWHSVLKHVELADAKGASERLSTGDEEFLDRTYDSHPKTVRRLAMGMAGSRTSQRQQRKYRMVDGEPTFACKTCQDSGYLQAVMPTSLEAAAAGRLKHPVHNPDGAVPLYTGVVACTCAEGQQRVVASQYARHGERPPPRILSANEQGVLLVTWIEEDWWPIVMEFVSGNYAAPTPAAGREFDAEDW